MPASRPRRAAALRNRYAPIPPRGPVEEILPVVFRTAASPTIPAGVQTPPSAPAISVVPGVPLRSQLNDPTSTNPRPTSAPRALTECAPDVSSIASATSQPSTWSADQMERIRQAAAIIHQSFASSTITEPATTVTTTAPIATAVAAPTVMGESCANLSVPIGNETVPMQSASTVPVPVTSQIMTSVTLRVRGHGPRIVQGMPCQCVVRVSQRVYLIRI